MPGISPGLGIYLMSSCLQVKNIYNSTVSLPYSFFNNYLFFQVQMANDLICCFLHDRLLDCFHHNTLTWQKTFRNRQFVHSWDAVRNFLTLAELYTVEKE